MHPDNTRPQTNHNVNTNTHRTRYVYANTHDIRIYSVNITIKHTIHKGKPKNHRTRQKSIFAETRLLKQQQTSRQNTRHSTRTLMLKPPSLQSNTTHEITQQISSQAPHDGCNNILNILCINPLKPNGHYRGRTAPLTSKVVFYILIQQI
jgi:hypothetical protein